MINLDALTLKLFCEENFDFFSGAKIRKIQQPNRSELIFHIRNFGETKKFYINFNPAFYHICFMSEKNEQRRAISIPKLAPMFCMLLRKYIQNARIIKVVVPEYERIFEIYFEYFDELNEKSQLCLAIELMGKYSNVILYNYDTNVIIGCAHNVSSEKSRERELCGMLPYVYPLKQKKKNLLNVRFETFKNNLESDNIARSISEKYHYLTISFVQDLIDSMTEFSVEELYKLLKDILSKKDFYPCISKDYSKYYVIKFPDSYPNQSISDMLDEYFSYHQLRIIINNLRQRIIKQLNNRIEKLNNLKTKQTIQIQKLDKALLYKTKADIIMANLYCLKKGMTGAKLYDFNGKEIEIDFNSTLTPIENANRYYSLYKKTKTAFEHARNLIEETNSQILYFDEMKYYALNSSDITELKDILSELAEDNNKKETNNLQNSQQVDFINVKGVKIYIGKNKKQNDYILSKLSSPEDLWFHPLNAPGAHVLVKRNNSKDEISDEVLLQAAIAAKEYSSQKSNSKTSIIYTKRKYVKKANNKQAFVTYKNETEIIV